MKILLGVQARSKSTRLPGKIFEKIGEKSLLEWVYQSAESAERKIRARKVDVVTAVLGHKEDDVLALFCKEKGIPFHLPRYAKEDDLIERYLQAMDHYNADAMVRLTSDCWLMNDDLIVEIAGLLGQCDYACNTISRSFIEGVDLQACRKKALQYFDLMQKEKREHPFYFFDRNERDREAFERVGFKYLELINPKNIWTIRTSIDTSDDLERARRLHAQQNPGPKLDRAGEPCSSPV